MVGCLLKSDDEIEDRAIECGNQGNYILYVNASNEKKDADGEIVSKQSLLADARAFLNRGTITWDHQARLSEDKNPAFIIGEPLDVYEKNNSIWVKVKLYRDNQYVKTIVSAIKNGATVFKASIGASRAKKQGNTIVGLTWDELAITYKPVNETLDSISVIKSQQNNNQIMTTDKIANASVLIEQSISNKRQNRGLKAQQAKSEALKKTILQILKNPQLRKQFFKILKNRQRGQQMAEKTIDTTDEIDKLVAMQEQLTKSKTADDEMAAVKAENKKLKAENKKLKTQKAQTQNLIVDEEVLSAFASAMKSSDFVKSLQKNSTTNDDNIAKLATVLKQQSVLLKSLDERLEHLEAGEQPLQRAMVKAQKGAVGNEVDRFKNHGQLNSGAEAFMASVRSGEIKVDSSEVKLVKSISEKLMDQQPLNAPETQLIKSKGFN